MNRRTLSLKREDLTELTAADLTRIAGAAPDASGRTCPVRDCVTNASDDLSCITNCFAYTCGCNTAPC